MNDYLSAEGTWRGPFWLADQPDREQRGVVTYDPDNGVNLTLVGGFDDGRWVQTGPGGFAMREGSGRFPVIHGKVGVKPVSLLDCRVTRSRSTGFGLVPDEQVVSVGRMLMGVLLDDPDAEAFSELTVELENLTRWDHRDDIMVYTKEDPKLPQGVEWKVTVNPVDSLRVTVDELTIELGRRYVRPSGNMRRSGLDSSSFVVSYLTVKSSSPKSIAQWGETEKQFQDLLTLAMDRPCAVLSETLTPSEALRKDENAEARGEVTLYARHINVGDPEAPSVETREAFFTLATEGVDFDTLIPRWVSVNNRFRTTCDMILGLRYVKRGYLQTQLIAAVAAAEAMHAAMEFDPPMPNSEFKALKKMLLEAVPADRRQWLREKLASNKQPLVTQLTDLAAIPDQEVMRRLVRNVDAWAKATKDERNPVAHGGDMSADVQLLSAITKVTEAVVLVNLLHQRDVRTGARVARQRRCPRWTRWSPL
jgi:ApeA N-terminal domain 1/Apea-like HEPN